MAEILEKISLILSPLSMRKGNNSFVSPSLYIDYEELAENLTKLQATIDKYREDGKKEITISKRIIENIILALSNLHPTIINLNTCLLERFDYHSNDKLAGILKFHLINNNAQNNIDFLKLLKSAFKHRNIVGENGLGQEFLSRCNLQIEETIKILNRLTIHQDIVSFPIKIIFAIVSNINNKMTRDDSKLIQLEFLSNYIIYHQPAYYPQTFPLLVNIVSKNLMNRNEKIRILCQNAIRTMELLLHPRRVPENFFLKKRIPESLLLNDESFNNYNENFDQEIQELETINPLLQEGQGEIELPDLILNPIE